MKDNKQISNSGLTFLDVLTVVFIVLKLLGKITWSWFWVLSPVWISLIIYVIIIIVLWWKD